VTGTSEMVRRTGIGIVRCPCCLPVINRETGPALPPLRNRGGICEPGRILAAKRVSCEQATGPGFISRIENGGVCRIRRGGYGQQCGTLEEGVWGRNLLKVSPLLARLHQILILTTGHAAESVPQKEQRQEIARKATAARRGKRNCLKNNSESRKKASENQGTIQRYLSTMGRGLGLNMSPICAM
jgi:hypothetical protein